MPTEHFKTAGDYRRWNAYRHIHGIAAPNLKTAVVAGVPHQVKHEKRYNLRSILPKRGKKGAK